MKKIAPILILLLVILAGVWVATRPLPQKSASPVDTRPAPIATAVYSCDKGATITAAYYEGPVAPTPAPGEPPTPTGSVEVSFSGEASTTLAQTLSADGARYATADESLVFWNKGNEAIIMRNNSMDLSYTNCVTSQ